MPIFEYRCTDCETRFEELVLSKASEPSACPDCSSERFEKVYSTFAAQSGGGFASAGSSESADPMCGRCGGPGPCAMN